jgi:putative (di)nucleoside polyphosphate hydrolase
MDLTQLRPNVGIVLVGRDGRVWLGRRSNSPPPLNWQFPQGGIDVGEAELGAALRELKEETGVSSVRLLGRTPGWLGYEFPPEHQGTKIAKGWKGQKQVWFALEFEGEDAEVDLASDEGDAEFDAWRWAELDEVIDAVIEFKREVYREVIKTFRPLIDQVRAGAR